MKLSSLLAHARFLISGSLLLSVWTLTGSTQAASVKVTELRCEYLANPLGLDVLQPRLSWRLEARQRSERGQKQTGYQVLVASTRESLKRDRGDLWDSGKVESTESINRPYAGQALNSEQECFWKVRVRDEAGAWSGWSEPAQWTMGLMSQDEWRAKWIGTDRVFARKQGWPPPDNDIPDPWLRKSFELSATPSRALVHLASIGYHELYVNGKKIGDAILEPSTTDNRHRARYRTYDIAKELKPGRNVLGIWLGMSWAIFPQYLTNDRPATAMALAQARIELPGGAKTLVVTDETWKTRPSPNTLLGVWDFMHFGGEFYDARQETPNWCDPQFDDSAWKTVTVYHPNLKISADKTEPNRLIKEIEPAAVSEPTNGVYRIDMGVNYAGWFEMQVKGKPGDRIDFEFSERENEPMTHRLHSAYIIGASGKGTFRNHFNYGVGRWVQVKGLNYKPGKGAARGWLVRTDYERSGGFECDETLLNRIYETTLWTFENLSLGNYVVDCPQRERMGYGGDAHATTRPALNNYRLGAFYTKWIEDWRDVQGPDGNLPYTSPTYWGGGGPGWSGYCITLPWEMYRRYGDLRILEENFPMMQRWLAFLETKAADDRLKRWGGEWDFLGDWLWPGAEGVNGDTRETLFYNNCYWIYNLRTAAKVASTLGLADVATKYRARAEIVRRAVHSKFFNPADSSYVNGFPAYLSIALLTGVPPEELRPAVWSRLENEILVNRKGHIHAGITGGAFLFTTLMESNRNDLIYPMVSKTNYPGWGDMLNRGATTFYEDWECKLSYLHSSYLYVGSWFIEGLGGIRHPEAGFKKFVIEPWINPANGPRKVQAHYDSLYGRVENKWEIKGDRITLNISVPPNTEAVLRLSSIDPATLQEGGHSLTGAGLSRSGDHSAQLRLEAGSYRFDAKLKP